MSLLFNFFSLFPMKSNRVKAMRSPFTYSFRQCTPPGLDLKSLVPYLALPW